MRMMVGNGDGAVVAEGPVAESEPVDPVLEPGDAADPEPDVDAELDPEPVVEVEDPPELSDVVEAPLVPDESDVLVL
jgi:hypothetical protein